MSETKLLPCPFCGGEAKICNGSNDIVGSQYAIRCKALNCTIRPVTEWHEELDEAIRHWNTRKPMDDIVERLEDWLNATGCIPKGTSYYHELLSIVRNAGKEGAE